MTTQTFNFEADTGKILNIVINSLYSQKEIFLRELISNASDAINKRKFEIITAGSAADTFDGKITITVHKKDKTITISDNGIGLSAEEMVETLGTIASSGTKAFMEAAKTTKDADKMTDQLIGQFGVGFYSAFMVADKVEVLSKKHDAKSANLWASDGQGGFSITDADRHETGTSVILYLRNDAKEYLEQERIAHLVKKYSDHIAQPIFWIGKDDAADQLNSSAALWTRPAKEISEDEYKSFYHAVASAYDKPFITLHNKTEGAVEFTNLLFIPSSAPFDLYDPERKSKLQLYVNRVFITDDYEGLVPKWLRFLRGIIDTPDVDLNVSREMLQQNPAVTKISKAVVKRTISEMKKALEKRRDDYANFWDGLGKVIKEGLYEDSANSEKLLEICLFRSTKTDKMITLQEYVDGFAQNQEVIYYLSADDAGRARLSPHLESFQAKDIDVLLLTDPIDDFWLSNIQQFAGKTFQSITRGEVNLSDIGEAKQKDDQPDETLSDIFVAKIKNVLEGSVANVRSSANMETSLARLVADENGMDQQMERMMRMHNPDFKGMPKILEVNAKHPLIKSLNAKLETGEFEGSDDFAKLILDTALVAEGEAIIDPRDFTRRISDVMQKALAG
ncbi:MAG: molecular chaperone HtpG [Alphaproteobacteria bacterium]|nr:molecular chaperone HtpG [Alphaproteobacteria bacterium]NDA17997.1 molecular chaperone HtpG [Alphaproteobacteria bacterium]NDG36153.1 molecular chaperone HtpG [Alphaproteobacteria bacterium]